MKKKVLSALLVAAMSVSVLAGCGSKADNNTDAKNDASQENTLSVWCWDPNFNVYAMKQAEAIYQKDHPDFKLDIQEKVYSDIETALITAAEADDYSTLPAGLFLPQKRYKLPGNLYRPDRFRNRFLRLLSRKVS